jgi:Lrp/AsnC family transcriptional regulator, leucine-responsive regulatory protein
MIDDIDRALLKLLQREARTRYADLGQAVHLSPPAVHERVKKMERLGVIRRYTIDVDPVAVGAGICAYVRVGTSHLACIELGQALLPIVEVEECHSVAGEDSVLIKVRTSSPAALENLLERIKNIPGVERTLTSVVLVTFFERGTAPDIVPPALSAGLPVRGR